MDSKDGDRLLFPVRARTDELASAGPSMPTNRARMFNASVESSRLGLCDPGKISQSKLYRHLLGVIKVVSIFSNFHRIL